jgi:WD40 repeat protein
MYTPDGRCVGRHAVYEDALGVKSVAWDPAGRYLAVGSYDQKVCVIPFRDLRQRERES